MNKVWHMKKDRTGIEYTILWEVAYQCLEDKDKKQLEAAMIKGCEGLGIKFEGIDITQNRVAISLMAKHSQNIGKVSTHLQKEVKSAGIVVTVGQSISVTRTGVPSKEDVRIRNVMEHVDEIAYYDLDEVCDEESAFKAYLGERPLTLVEMGSNLFLIDEAALSIPIYLNCFECTKTYQYGCCCGSPCDMSEKNKKTFRKYEKQIEESLKETNPEDYEKLMQYGGFTAKDGSINEYEGRCAMLVEEDGIYKCMTHKYALDHSMPIYDLCPLSCLMYPLEIIELIVGYKTKAILLTSAVEETFAKDFSRWGSYKKLDVDLRCLDKGAHDAQFHKEKYKPVYEVNKGLLSHEFGASLYSTIKYIIE